MQSNSLKKNEVFFRHKMTYSSYFVTVSSEDYDVYGLVPKVDEKGKTFLAILVDLNM